MMERDEHRFHEAIERTRVVRTPQQMLATFGTTAIKYYLVTEPVYASLESGRPEESVVREGVVRAERPQVVTPFYLTRHEGFGDNAEEFIRYIMQHYGADAPGLLYTYHNEQMETNVVSGSMDEVSKRIVEQIDKEERKLEAVILGSDELWDVSLMKFIYDFTSESVRSNVSALQSRGLLEMDRGVPRDARVRIERMLTEARKGTLDPSEVHQEIERWGLFDEYEDQFLALFKRTRSR